MLDFELEQVAWQIQTPTIASILTEAREEAHQAAQIIACAARSYMPADEKDKYAALMWWHLEKGLVTQTFGTENRSRVALRLQDLTLIFLEVGKRREEFTLINRTQDEAIEWLKGQLEKAGFDPAKYEFSYPYDFPDYPQGRGEKFTMGNRGMFLELAINFANADQYLQQVHAFVRGASRVRIWPHHFDIATLITYKDDSGDETKTREINIGMSAGDENINEPYYYVTPKPHLAPNNINYPVLPGRGFWNKEPWFGTALKGSDFGNTPLEQMDQLKSFLEGAAATSVDLTLAAIK
ncbi:MAG TPA: hypothetical protein DCE41_16695 [Cytophagales bacterium]|nr:hypothetical protein [Cytophagales bacterium]HAA18719.1 hypothetical protein [Cytophagales bacterium]HAP63933.1 hypothetical protein [Cytophagales bacterium]